MATLASSSPASGASGDSGPAPASPKKAKAAELGGGHRVSIWVCTDRTFGRPVEINFSAGTSFPPLEADTADRLRRALLEAGFTEAAALVGADIEAQGGRGARRCGRRGSSDFGAAW
jgi:hypothetical protein